MVQKLNFGIKQKRMLIALVIILALFLVNSVVSTLTFEANPKSLEISNVHMIRDHNYNGEDANRDWNTTINLEMKSKNPFFKPIADELLVFEDNGTLTMQTNWSFSLFNIFDTYRTVKADQSILINEDILNDNIIFKLYGEKSNKVIPFNISDINK